MDAEELVAGRVAGREKCRIRQIERAEPDQRFVDQRETAWLGRELIAGLRRQAEGRIVIMAGGGVDESNAAELVRETGVAELHVRGTMPWREQVNFHDDPVPFRRNLAADETIRFVTDPVRIGAIRAAAEIGLR